MLDLYELEMNGLKTSESEWGALKRLQKDVISGNRQRMLRRKRLKPRKKLVWKPEKSAKEPTRTEDSAR
jgi:hypothetical protein